MTLKNTDRFEIEVINRQVNNGETDYIRESGTGSLRIKDGRYYLIYKTDTATVMIRIDGDTANVKRTGESSSDMDYKPGRTTAFEYNTPYGNMRMELFTKKLDYTLDETGGVIKIQYELCDIDNNMQISVREKR